MSRQRSVSRPDRSGTGRRARVMQQDARFTSVRKVRGWRIICRREIVKSFCVGPGALRQQRQTNQVFQLRRSSSPWCFRRRIRASNARSRGVTVSRSGVRGGGVSLQALADAHGVSESSIWQIIHL